MNDQSSLTSCLHVAEKEYVCNIYHANKNKAGYMSHAGGQGQGPYLRSLDHLGRSSEAKDCKKTKKVKCDRPTDGPTDGLTDGPIDRPMD